MGVLVEASLLEWTIFFVHPLSARHTAAVQELFVQEPKMAAFVASQSQTFPFSSMPRLVNQ